METSDSEYFESADEDLESDDEKVATVPKTKKSDHPELKKLKSEEVKITEEGSKANVTAVNNNIDADKDKIENLAKDVENNIKLCDATKTDSTSEEPNTKSMKEDTKKELVGNVIDDKITSKEKMNVPHDDNLWDDNEVDWGEEKNEENMWDNDDWEPFDEPKQQTQQTKLSTQTQPMQERSSLNSTTWGSWGNWGMSSIISTATQGVSTLTQGITTVLETGIGVPDPEELARVNSVKKEELKRASSCEKDVDEKNTNFGLGNLVMGMSHLTKLVETTGTRVITGGLDTLETIGKKTMEVLQEGDPGLKKKRAFLKIDQDKPVLSQLLREAKEKAENENRILEEKHFAKKAKNYETLFDDHQGLVHLEALEMLSKQCDIKLQTLLESYTDEALTDMQETMEQVKELCELPDEEEDEQIGFTEIKSKLESAVTEINIPISYKKLNETWEETETWLNNLKLDICDGRELHQQAIETLAQLTAIAVEQFHKTGELLLVKEHRSTADEADSLVQLTTTLTSLIGIVAAKFSEKLNVKSSNSSNKEEINGLITNVFFEAANSSSYIQDAFQLLIPVLQVGAV